MNDITLATGVLLKEIPIAPAEFYRAGSDGQIYSRFRYKGHGKILYRDWHPLKAWPDAKGWYRHVSISYDGKKITRSVHTLICMAFHGIKPFPSAEVRHIDGDNQNSKPDNLAWGTRYENWADRKTQRQRNEGESNSNSKLNNFERSAVRWAIRMGLCSQHHAAKMLHLSQHSIGQIARSSIDWGFGVV